LTGAECFIGLTGTLVQNQLLEFWWLFNLIKPGCLGTEEDFKVRFEQPILRGRKASARRSDVLLGKERLRELGEVRDLMMLRRTK
ncbi:unnamed protein product, partial [Discosporangium mesarthrocarpum]